MDVHYTYRHHVCNRYLYVPPPHDSKPYILDKTYCKLFSLCSNNDNEASTMPFLVIVQDNNDLTLCLYVSIKDFKVTQVFTMDFAQMIPF